MEGSSPPPTTVCLTANCFTLEGRPVKENKYISILFFWLAALSGKGFLGPADELYLSFDRATFEYLDTSPYFNILITRLPCKPQIRTYSPPKTFLEGAIERYRVPLTYKSEILLYLDLDILLLKPLSFLAQRLMTPDTIYLSSEGDLSHFCYNHGFPEFLQNICTNKYLGFNSGKFAIRGKEQARQLFSAIEYVFRKIPPSIEYRSFYTGDQPLFNQAIYRWLLLKESRINVNTDLFEYPLISVNSIPIEASACFCIDLMGDPGNEEFHLQKILHFYPLLLCGWFG